MPIDLSKLSDEERAEYEHDQRELSEQRETRKTERIDKRIDEIKAMGLDEEHGFSGFLRVVRERMLADDGEPALVLSENGRQRGETATEIIDAVIGALPLKDGKLAVQLSEQHFEGSSGVRPKDNGNDERTPQEKADEFRKKAGIQSHLITK